MYKHCWLPDTTRINNNEKLFTQHPCRTRTDGIFGHKCIYFPMYMKAPIKKEWFPWCTQFNKLQVHRIYCSYSGLLTIPALTLGGTRCVVMMLLCYNVIIFSLKKYCTFTVIFHSACHKYFLSKTQTYYCLRFKKTTNNIQPPLGCDVNRVISTPVRLLIYCKYYYIVFHIQKS